MSNPRLIPVLRAGSQNRRDLALGTFSVKQIRWAVETGLGALLFYVTFHDPQASISPFWPMLKSADLTSRIYTAEQLDAVAEIINACEPHIQPLTLLKGISICGQYYPEPHLRPMRDIDFMIEASEVPAVETVLLKLGYRRRSKGSSKFYDQHHHRMPLFHPEKEVWVEIHRGVFPPKKQISDCEVYSSANSRAESRVSEFRGRTVKRLSNELQVVYTACH